MPGLLPNVFLPISFIGTELKIYKILVVQFNLKERLSVNQNGKTVDLVGSKLFVIKHGDCFCPCNHSQPYVTCYVLPLLT